MTISIIASGQSAENWTPEGLSIGCNDAGKWGNLLDAILVCNRPEQFSKERMEIIKNTKVEKFYSNKSNWSQWFPKWEKVPLVTWYGSYNPKQVYSSNTSPFIAISLAAKLGAKKIVLWGVDFVNHKTYSAGNPQTQREVKAYLELIEAMKPHGVSVYLGAKGTAFDDHIQLDLKPICTPMGLL